MDVFPTGAPAGPYVATMSVFNGLAPNGVWSLYVLDDEAGDLGSFSGGWSLAITTSSAGPASLGSTRTTGLAAVFPAREDSVRVMDPTAPYGRPSIQSVTVLPQGQVRLVLHGQAGQSYRIQISSNLTDWQDLRTEPAPSDEFDVIDASARPADSPRFYRVLTTEP
jgi:hypothetical protein